MEHKFEPFERVLVRASNIHTWKCGIFSHLDKIEPIYVCICSHWSQCIPYAGNEHLLGTTESPEQEHEYQWGDKITEIHSGMFGVIIGISPDDEYPIRAIMKGKGLDPLKYKYKDIKPVEGEK